MTHVYHPSLPGYSEESVLHDGCGECERRAESIQGLLELDGDNLATLWRLMQDFERTNPPTRRPTSRADREACRHLLAMALLLDRLPAVTA